MSFHVIAYCASVDSAVLAAITPVPDPMVRVSGNDVIVPPDLPNLGAFFATGPSITGAQLVSPTLRKSLNVDIAPVSSSSNSPAYEDSVSVLFDNPIALAPRDILDAMASENGAGATRLNVVAWLMDKKDPVPAGSMSTLRLTGTTTLVAYNWTNVPLTATQSLAPGTYAIVGMSAGSSGCMAARLVLPGNPWRPGVPGGPVMPRNNGYMPFRFGRIGMFGTFQHDIPPTVDFLSSTADTSEEIFLDVVGPLAGK